MTQHEIRQLALQGIYLANQHPDWTEDEVAQHLQASMNVKAMPAYADELISLVREHQTDLQAAISQYLKKGWSWDRLSQIDRAILLLAATEIKYSQKITNVGAINEALNLCEEFGDPKSKRFINGILAKFVD